MTTTYNIAADIVRTRRGAVRLTDQIAKGLCPPVKGNRIVYDDQVRGFGLRVTKAGRKAFVLNYRISGRERRMTIGAYPDWTVVGARKQAEEFRREVDIGIDPLQRREDKRAEPTIEDLFERYCSEHLPKKSESSVRNDIQMWQKSILPTMRRRKVADITFDEVDALHRKITRRAPIQANRTISLLRKAFNLAKRWGWLKTNPATGLQLNPENKRTRYLSEDEIARLLSALEANPNRTSCDLITFLMLTGCRRGEAFTATWAQFDPAMRVWEKPAASTKQRKLHRVPVSSAVTALLERRKATSKSPYIFASPTGMPLTDVKKTWARVCNNADICDVKMHDLRHTFASVLVSKGLSLPIIGAMLGHTQTQTTARYAHLYDSTLSHAAKVVADTLKISQK